MTERLKMDLEALPPEEIDTETELLFNTLTPAEKKIMEMIAAGLSEAEVAKNLGIAQKTVSVHKNNLTLKLGINNAASIARIWMKFGNKTDPFIEEETLS